MWVLTGKMFVKETLVRPMRQILCSFQCMFSWSGGPLLMLDGDKQATVIIGILRGGGSKCGFNLPKKYQDLDPTTEWTKVSLFLTWIKEVMQHKHKGKSLMFRNKLHYIHKFEEK